MHSSDQQGFPCDKLSRRTEQRKSKSIASRERVRAWHKERCAREQSLGILPQFAHSCCFPDVEGVFHRKFFVEDAVVVAKFVNKKQICTLSVRVRIDFQHEDDDHDEDVWTMHQ